MKGVLIGGKVAKGGSKALKKLLAKFFKQAG
jgi:hypothetical protein